jgi:acyl transferase domain-containing protein
MSVKTGQIHRAELAQPLCTAVQIALVNAMARCGIRPNAVIGHSSGEIAAAYATGALSLSEAMIVAYYRGYITKEPKMAGGMAAIGLGKDATSTFLRGGVVVACENSPDSTTISGDLDQLLEVIKSIKEERPDILARQLKIDMAYHSRKHH